MQVHPDTTNSLDLLSARLAALERRVAALEHSSQTVAQPTVELEQTAEPTERVASAGSDAGMGTTFTGAFSLLGGALLGIAGAYVLRAISGASMLPRGVVAGLAAIYATAWMVAAARAGSQRLAAALFAGTSILILAPMLWEMSIRFRTMSGMEAAFYLAAYATIATVLGFRSIRSTAFALVGSGTALTAVALCIGTHSMMPFAAILLAMHGVCELTALRERAHSVRVVTVVCADFSVWAILHVYPLAPGEQSGYPPLSTAVIVAAVALLFAIEVAGLFVYAIQRACRLSVLSILQTMVAFALLVFTITWFLPVYRAQAVGFFSLTLAIGGYAAAYGPIRRAGSRRNQVVFIVWSFALFCTAVFLLASTSSASVILGLIASVAVLLAARTRMHSVATQGAISLCAAAFASGLFSYAFTALAGSMPVGPTWSVVLVAACSAFAYAVAGEAPREPALKQVLHLVLALLAALSGSSLLAQGLADLAARALSPNVLPVAVLRTLALCIMAVVLTWLGSRLGRVQMVRAAYAALALAVVKLLYEDLRNGRMEFAAVSIFLVACTFIGVPRLARAPADGRARQ